VPRRPRTKTALKIAVIVPCYQVRDNILQVLEDIPEYVKTIYCIDDACPDKSGQLIEEQCKDPRVQLISHSENQGVGGALISGYKRALRDNMDVAIKIDGDGQMDPALIPRFVSLLESGHADYCKGNRFYRPATLQGMPKRRIFGNAVLSFVTKMSSGYWNVIDPTNGYTAIHATALRLLPLDSIDRGYFFESEMLFRLNTIRAVVRDIPMNSVYKNEISNLKIRKVIVPFLFRNIKNFGARIVYNYYLRDFNLASLEWPIGIGLLGFGTIFGASNWIGGINNEEFASAGTVMVGALSIMIGMQMLLSAFNFDMQNVPKTPLQQLFRDEEDLGFMSARLPASPQAKSENTETL
jgi:dolichol-phosphate mannosyltransferase